MNNKVCIHGYDPQRCHICLTPNYEYTPEALRAMLDNIIAAAEAYIDAVEDKLQFYGVPKWDIAVVTTNLQAAIKKAKSN